MRRISVLGSPGAGKTTFSKKAASKLGLEHIELDLVYWGPNWHKPTDKVFQNKLADLITKVEARNPNGWIMCGNFTHSLEGKYQDEADTVLLFQLPMLLVIWRVSKRSIKRLFTQEEVFPGCKETIRGAFIGRYSLLGWIILKHPGKVKQTRELMKRLGKEENLIIFRSNKAAYLWLENQTL
jgi:adenylate kinase family enzyme